MFGIYSLGIILTILSTLGLFQLSLPLDSAISSFITSITRKNSTKPLTKLFPRPSKSEMVYYVGLLSHLKSSYPKKEVSRVKEFGTLSSLYTITLAVFFLSSVTLNLQSPKLK